MGMMASYEKPLCRVRELELEVRFLDASNENYPVDPFDPEFD